VSDHNKREAQIREIVINIHSWLHAISHFLQQPPTQISSSYPAPLHGVSRPRVLSDLLLFLGLCIFLFKVFQLNCLFWQWLAFYSIFTSLFYISHFYHSSQSQLFKTSMSIPPEIENL
jgi:hypothetical protein